MRLEIGLHLSDRVVFGLSVGQKAIPGAVTSPVVEAIVAGLPGTTTQLGGSVHDKEDQKLRKQRDEEDLWLGTLVRRESRLHARVAGHTRLLRQRY
jgi:hypothetical protein